MKGIMSVRPSVRPSAGAEEMIITKETPGKHQQIATEI
jgi:hypothetical protein